MGHRTRSHARGTLAVLLASGLVWSMLAPQASGQENGPGIESAADAQLGPRVDDLKLAHVAVARTPLEQIDHVFNAAVEALGRVLFYGIGRHERQYVQFDERQTYYRPAGSDGPFTALDPQDPKQELTANDITARRALDELILREDNAPVWQGTLDGQPVEVVMLRVNEAKFVMDNGKYRRVLPRLQRLAGDDDPADVLSEQQVISAAQRGALKAVDASHDGGDLADYLHTEHVGGIPVVVFWLASGAVFFTLYMRGFNLWGFWHAIRVVRGHYDDPNEPGEVTHFQALSSALSATVGLGNIAGVTIAMSAGGPGAFFWMMCCGLFGMTSKFTECTLGVKYRHVNPDGTVLGGPMQYLYHGLKELGLGHLGYVLSIMFTIMCILASFGGGNMFQANQSGQQVLSIIQMREQERLAEVNLQIKDAAKQDDFSRLEALNDERAALESSMAAQQKWVLPVYGIVLAIMTGIVIIGGIKRIGAAASKVVPIMCLTYITACLFIIFRHVADVPSMVAQIFTEAFNPTAFGGGILGVLVIGVQRAAFSNEAGVGSAAIAHSAARTDEPIREGAVALLEPFIDTVIVCSMTALVILITGAWENEEWIVNQELSGAPLTSKAFKQEISWFPYILSIAIVLFAYSTLISWSYYGERSWARLFGERSTTIYKILFIIAAFIGPIVSLKSVLDFSDMMILSMAFPNVLGLLLLAPSVRRDLLDYWRRLKAGEFQEDRVETKKP